ncbi:MAG: hypothetical protein IJW18_06700 [Lachnospiraceae bacterium]|nr:hypothetical protein [Lachnospiraceae bacterium]
MKRTAIKRMMTGFLCAVLMCAGVITVMAEGVQARLNNVGSVSSNAWVSDSGALTIAYQYMGNSDTEGVVIKTYIEKRTLGFFWSDVDMWTDILYDTDYYDTTTIQLDSDGVYRVTVEYTFYGTGGRAEVVTHEIEVEY